MAKKNVVTVVVAYKASQYPFYDEVIEKVAAKYGAESYGSGLGFGERDMSFDVMNSRADDFVDEVEQLPHVTYAEVQ